MATVTAILFLAAFASSLVAIFLLTHHNDDTDAPPEQAD